jgi:inorganic pyrophosphatase
VSPVHDISLYRNKEQNIFNMIVEIPRWSNAKMEVNKKEKLNPITQDVKSNKPRFVNNCFPHHGYIWNYGALPQTFEDPNVLDKITNCMGDNDPLDVLEIGSKVHKCGSVVGVKVLGALGLIDEGEADWKIVAIDVTDPLAAQLNDIDDVEKHMPGLLDATRDWMKIYKIPTGKPINKIALDGKVLDKKFALEQIHENNKMWQDVIDGKYNSEPGKLKGMSLVNTTLSNAISKEDAEKVVEESSEPHNTVPFAIDRTPIDTVHYIDRNKL